MEQNKTKGGTRWRDKARAQETQPALSCLSFPPFHYLHQIPGKLQLFIVNDAISRYQVSDVMSELPAMVRIVVQHFTQTGQRIATSWDLAVDPGAGAGSDLYRVSRQGPLGIRVARDNPVYGPGTLVAANDFRKALGGIVVGRVEIFDSRVYGALRQWLGARHG